MIGVPIKGMLDGLDAMLSIIQMPPGIPVATVGVNGAMNAAILAVEMIALADEDVAARLAEYKAGLGAKIEKANKELAEVTSRQTDAVSAVAISVTALTSTLLTCPQECIRHRHTLRRK